jgi:hypothetical protein
LLFLTASAGDFDVRKGLNIWNENFWVLGHDNALHHVEKLLNVEVVREVVVVELEEVAENVVNLRHALCQVRVQVFDGLTEGLHFYLFHLVLIRI